MGQHFDLVCQYGYKHGTCRCVSKDKVVRKMECNTPSHAEKPKNGATTESGKLQELYDIINDFAEATQQGKLDTAVNTHEEFVLLAHNATVTAKHNSDAATRALWPDKGRGC